MAVLAGVLALYGSMHAEKQLAGSPLREARGSAGLLPPQDTQPLTEFDRAVLARTEQSKNANDALQVVAYVLPFFLGLAAVLTAGWAMKIVQASGGKYTGDMLAVFSMMIGGLASVVAFCMIVSLYLWPHMPSLYTT